MGRKSSRLVRSPQGKQEVEEEQSNSVGIMQLVMRALMGTGRKCNRRRMKGVSEQDEKGP